MNLYELTGAYKEILSMFQDENSDQQMLIDTLESLDGAIEDKADNYAKIIKTLEGESDIININGCSKVLDVVISYTSK